MAATDNQTQRLKDLLSKRKSELGRLDTQKFKEAEERFEEANGCTRCRGRGQVVTWDTLDSMSGCYAEYGACPNEACTVETRQASGLHPSNTKYDRNCGTCWTPSLTAQETVRGKEIEREISQLQGEIDIENRRWTLAEGKLVRVVKPQTRGPKARRVPVGVEGLVVKVFTNDWGTTKLIVTDSSGKKWWPSERQVEVIDPDPDREIWDALDKKDREENGFPLIGIVKKNTGRAVLLRTTTGVEMWIPHSQAKELKNKKKGETISVCVPMWIATKKGLVTLDNARQ